MFGDSNKYESKELREVSNIIAGGDKPDGVSKVKMDTKCYPVYANGVENEGLQGYYDSYKIDKPSVTISARGTIGKTFIRKEKFTPIVRLITITPKHELDVTYLKYALDAVSLTGNGSSQQQITVPNIKKIKIPVPNIDKQLIYTRLVEEIDKSKFEIENALSELKKLYQKIIADNIQ